MNNKSTLEPRVKSFVEFRLQHYHEDRRQLKEYYEEMMPSSTADYSGEAHGGGESRPSEVLAVRLVTDRYIQSTEVCLKCIESVLSRADKETINMVNLVYWRGSHTVTGAAMALHISQATAYRKINKLLRDMALELGYISL